MKNETKALSRVLLYLVLFNLVFCLAVGAQELTKLPEGFAGAFDLNKVVTRKNDVFPLSDQDNRDQWILVNDLCDEFNSESLDCKRWYPTNPGWSGRPPTMFHTSNVSVGDGTLCLALNKHGSAKLPEGYTHTCGYIKSKGTFLYGYFEARIKCICAPWVSGFWLYDATEEWWTEIDICENCPCTEQCHHALNSNLHVFRAPKEHSDVKEHFDMPKKYYLPLNLADDYHVWGLEWKKDVIRFYLDGVLFRETPNTHWHQPLTVNINCESNKWLGALPDDSKLGERMLVDYFRCWQQESLPAKMADAEPVVIPNDAGGESDSLHQQGDVVLAR